MNPTHISLSMLRFALSGALIGVAITGVVYQFPYHDIVGGVVGFTVTLIAKYKHIL